MKYREEFHSTEQGTGVSDGCPTFLFTHRPGIHPSIYGTIPNSHDSRVFRTLTTTPRTLYRSISKTFRRPVSTHPKHMDTRVTPQDSEK